MTATSSRLPSPGDAAGNAASIAGFSSPNSPADVYQRMQARKISRTSPWLVLPLRTILFALTQAFVAGVLALAGSQNAWSASINWWPVYLIVPNLITLAALVALTHQEGLAFTALWKHFPNPGSRSRRGEILTWTGLLLAGVPVGGIGFIGAAVLLYGGKIPEYVGPLPMWAALLSLSVMPLSIALVELPAYMGYALPRLEAISGQRWLPLGLVVFWLALQHSALPLIFDTRFILYRFISMLPMALYIGLVYQHMRRLGPLMVLHYLLDLQLGITIFMLSLPK